MTPSQLLSVIAEDGAVQGEAHGLSKDELLHLYRTMLLTRAFDDTCMKLQRSGRIGFSVPNKGVEASSVGAASAFRADDWLFPSYRDFGVLLYHGIQLVDMMHNMFGNALDTSKGRQMPVHFSFDDPVEAAARTAAHAVQKCYGALSEDTDTEAACGTLREESIKFALAYVALRSHCEGEGDDTL